MRSVLTALVVLLGALPTNVAVAQNAPIFTGSGVVIGTHGEILTNAHVVERCNSISVQFPSEQAQPAVLVADDQRNDLAVIRSKNPRVSVAAFREGKPLRAGDAVVALGYPLSGLLASAANVSTGIVSALAGVGDDSRHLQISAPVQPGNSGGPLLDASGHIVGIVAAKLNAVSIARLMGDIPQNVNFAIKAEVARAFLDSRGIHYKTARSDQQLSPADVGDMARPLTAYIQCQRAGLRSAGTENSRSSQASLAACANWVVDQGVDKVIPPNLATLLLNVSHDVPVRQKAFQDANGTLHILDVATNQDGPDMVFLAVANAQRTKNVFFVASVDGVLHRTAASYEKQPATVVPNTSHPDLFAKELEYWSEKLPKK